MNQVQPQGLADLPSRDGQTYDHARDARRLAGQHARVLAYMRHGRWATLSQIATNTGDPEASVSARLRDLRKPQHGGYKIERRYVCRGLHEYRLVIGQLELIA